MRRFRWHLQLLARIPTRLLDDGSTRLLHPAPSSLRSTAQEWILASSKARYRFCFSTNSKPNADVIARGTREIFDYLHYTNNNNKDVNIINKEKENRSSSNNKDNNNNNEAKKDAYYEFFGKTPSVPLGFWHDVENHRRFFEWASKPQQLNIQSLDDWYRISHGDISKLGGAGLLADYYNNSLIRALSAVYPEHEWLPWKFRVAPMGFWNDEDNQRWFLGWVAQQLHVHKLDDWYHVSPAAVRDLGGSRLIDANFKGSLANALMTLYPEHEWLPWKFTTVPHGFWRHSSNQRRFFEWAAKQLGLRDASTSPEDWYRVSNEDIYRLGGTRLIINYYDGSLASALVSAFPEFEWEPWRFQRFSSKSSFIRDETVLRRYIQAIAKELRIEQLDDWYRASLSQIRKQVGGYTILKANGGLYAVLKKLYPEHQWDEERFSKLKSKKSTQRWLYIVLQKLFPDEEILEDYPHPELCFADSNEPMTLDIWIPSISLAFEYQGTQHYRDIHVFGDPSMLKRRDVEKSAACANAGINLVVIPYWWNKSTEDLAATICAARPDLATAARPLLLQALARGATSSPLSSSSAAASSSLGSPIIPLNNNNNNIDDNNSNSNSNNNNNSNTTNSSSSSSSKR